MQRLMQTRATRRKCRLLRRKPLEAEQSFAYGINSGAGSDPANHGIGQLQHIRSNWLACKEVTGRTDQMNCYIWDGAEWA